MPAISPKSKVLITGINGFIGSWISKELLDRGFLVRGTVRSAAKGEELQRVLGNADLEIVVVPDITQPGAFDEAVKDVDAVIHTASPVIAPEGDPSVVIAPAVSGTTVLLNSAKSLGTRIKRVVVTSSVSAAIDTSKQSFYKYTEADWNDVSVKEVNEKGKDAPPVAKYHAAKALAERAVWEFTEKNKDSISFDIVTVLPVITWGPVLLPMTKPTDTSTSMGFLWSWVKNPSSDPATFLNYFANVVDVRDVATLHVESLVNDKARGHRFLIGRYPMYPQFAYDTINNSEELKKKNVTAPLGNPGATIQAPVEFDDEPARTILGITTRPIDETIVAAIGAFADAGLLP